MTNIIPIGDTEYQLLEKIRASEDRQVADILFREGSVHAASFRLFLQQESLVDDPDALVMLGRLEELEAQRPDVNRQPEMDEDSFEISIIGNVPFVQYTKRKRLALIEESYKLYYGPLLTFVSRIIEDKSAAQDIVQSVFLKLLNHAATVESGAKIRGLLYTLARHASIDWYRKRDKNKIFLSQMRLHLSVDNNLPNESEYLRFLVDAIPHLPQQAKKVIESIFVEGRTIHETAKILGISESNVRFQKSRGLKLLRNLLEARSETRRDNND